MDINNILEFFKIYSKLDFKFKNVKRFNALVKNWEKIFKNLYREINNYENDYENDYGNVKLYSPKQSILQGLLFFIF